MMTDFDDENEVKPKIEQPIEKHECPLCDYVTDHHIFLKRHMRLKHLFNNMFNCTFCDKTYKNHDLDRYLFHLTKDHQIGNFALKCDECDYICATAPMLNKHVRLNHTNQTRSVCDTCGKSFISPETLENHKKSVHGQFTITSKDIVKSCEKCNEEFSQSDIFESHLRSCLNEFKDFQCKFCDSKWASHLSLEMHCAIEHQKIIKVCDICGWMTQQRGSITKHKKTHQEIKDFVCDLCAKSFIKKVNFEAHLFRDHGIGEQKFKCETCGQTFFKESVMKHHIEAKHVKSKLYQCELCPKAFWMRSYLTTHIKNYHMKYKPNKCDLCPEAYLTKRDLIKHKANVHHV